MDFERRLRELGFSLPEPVAVSYRYDAVVRRGGQVFVSGQLPWRDGAIAVTGLLGADVTTVQGILAAQPCGLLGTALSATLAWPRRRQERKIARCTIDWTVEFARDFPPHSAPADA